MILDSNSVASVSRQLLGGTDPDGAYAWSRMSPQPNCKALTEDVREEIGALCFDAGLAIHTTYGISGSTAYTSLAKDALIDTFQYANAVYTGDSNRGHILGLVGIINPNLDAGYPVLLSLDGSDADATAGHVVVCDGYGYHASTMYHHLNLGWDLDNRQSYDVWYDLPDVNSPSEEFSLVSSCIYNVFPEQTGEIVSGRVCDTAGLPIAGAIVRAESADGTHILTATTDTRGIYGLVGCRSDCEYRVSVADYQAASGASRTVRTGTSVTSCPTSGNRWGVDFPVADEPAGPHILRVDGRAAGAVRDGASWAGAFTNLQDAIAAAADGSRGGRTTEIWVARGTYTPEDGPKTARDRSFRLMDDVALYGGFAGWETQRGQRDSQANITILSGDLAGNDAADQSTSRSDNSYHVVNGSGTNATAILDGFIIVNGNAEDDLPTVTVNDCGGGLFVSRGNPTISNCVISSNRAAGYGGAMYIAEGSRPSIVHCTFLQNHAQYGGALVGMSSHFIATDCIFTENLATSLGGAVCNSRGNPTLTGCTFTGNSSPQGAGMDTQDGDPILTECTFNANVATSLGGGVDSARGEPRLRGCIFTRNSARQGAGMNSSADNLRMDDCAFSLNSAVQLGGGLYLAKGDASLIHCRFYGNKAPYGGGVFSDTQGLSNLFGCLFSGNQATTYGGGVFSNPDSQATITNCTFNANSSAAARTNGATILLRNCIAWTSKLEGIASTSVFASTIQGYGNTGTNSGQDPRFVDADGADNITGTDDDDLRLLPASPCIDKGSKEWLPRDAADLDADGDLTELLPWDLDGNRRIVGSDVDRGAYEFQGP